jgi:hypothetical protein
VQKKKKKTVKRDHAYVFFLYRGLGIIYSSEWGR